MLRSVRQGMLKKHSVQIRRTSYRRTLPLIARPAASSQAEPLLVSVSRIIPVNQSPLPQPHVVKPSQITPTVKVRVQTVLGPSPTVLVIPKPNAPVVLGSRIKPTQSLVVYPFGIDHHERPEPRRSRPPRPGQRNPTAPFRQAGIYFDPEPLDAPVGKAL